jgi:predicted DNA binding CopG/RHH family protein
MRKEYDFSNSVKNPYAKRFKKQITIRIENETIDYFKDLAQETDIPYQKLINLFLRDCAQNNRKPSIKWLSNQES